MYIFVAVDKMWSVATSEDYKVDDTTSWAYASSYDKNGNERCPHDLDYWLSLNNKWTLGYVSVRDSGEHISRLLIVLSRFQFDMSKIF